MLIFSIDLHCLLQISENRLVTGSNSNLICVYKRDQLKKTQILPNHRESVRCLVKISDTYFASGSMDGAIIVWSADSLQTFKVLHCPSQYRNDKKVYIYDVKSLLALKEV